MNIIFLTLYYISDIKLRGLYHDLMRKFRDEGHQVYIITPCERRMGLNTSLEEKNGVKILKVKTLNIQKTNVIEKGIGTLLMERQYKAAIKKYFRGIKFDLITYSTPPITFTNVVRYLKRKNPNALTYLQLKDIFPHNAVDIGMFGEKSVLNWYFRRKEKALYQVSDYIGCMSPANVKYVVEHNPEVDASKVEVAPNSVELTNSEVPNVLVKNAIREKYGIPVDKPVLIYGGNLGKPQGIDYLIKCLDANKERKDCYFVVVGSGTEQQKIQTWYDTNKPENTTVLKALPKADYDTLVQTCDVGLIFLDHRFTIPNYPSRLLSYLEYKMPVICATDPNTDIGSIAEEKGYGFWCVSVKPEDFTTLVDKMLTSDRKAMGEKGYEFLKANYTVEHTYNAIMKHFEK